MKIPQIIKSNTQLMLEEMRSSNPFIFDELGIKNILGNGNVLTFSMKRNKVKIVMNPKDKIYTLYINKKRTTNLSINDIIEILNRGALKI